MRLVCPWRCCVLNLTCVGLATTQSKWIAFAERVYVCVENGIADAVSSKLSAVKEAMEGKLPDRCDQRQNVGAAG